MSPVAKLVSKICDNRSMLFAPDKDKVLALAGLVQSGKLVTQLAAEPEHDQAALKASTRSLLVMHPQSMDEIFGGVEGLNLGLQTMASLFKGRGLQSVMAKELIRYLMSMDQLAHRLAQSPPTQAVIEKGLYELNIAFESSPVQEQEQLSSSDNEEDAFFAAVSTLYQKSLSQLEPKIIVRGAKGYLQDEASVTRVRSALFAGVRAAFLWHQQGARRWHLLFSRRAYADMAARLVSVR